MTMTDAAEATILVTGATDGLGRRVAQELAAMGATVLLHGRSPERLEATLEELRNQTGSEKANSYLADLSSLDAVRNLAERILSGEDRLDVLVNNAGMIARERKESEDGYELTFAVNYLSHFLRKNSQYFNCTSFACIHPFRCINYSESPVADISTNLANQSFRSRIPATFVIVD